MLGHQRNWSTCKKSHSLICWRFKLCIYSTICGSPKAWPDSYSIRQKTRWHENNFCIKNLVDGSTLNMVLVINKQTDTMETISGCVLARNRVSYCLGTLGHLRKDSIDFYLAHHHFLQLHLRTQSREWEWEQESARERKREPSKGTKKIGQSDKRYVCWLQSVCRAVAVAVWYKCSHSRVHVTHFID